ncbi:MAG TPA: alcohol dehydrogenase catalytic domain-containing protein [Phycisphaerae bacterium]|nr:alcohol dehydrogenase catalytic domain-containing protein [Phycisphaerae bacterium]HPS52456.1 alcohol dehydrogenase catalytic domain-containing protein [Phycisphaerae bacterium]
MKALFFDGKNLQLRTDLPAPSPSEGEVLIKVITAGVCKTDLEILKGYMGFRGIIGHEFVGVVEHGPKQWLARRVTAEINNPCHVCPTCKAGRGKHCPHRSVMGIDGHDGAMAQYVTAPAENLVAIPDDVPNDSAVFIEPLAAAFEPTTRMKINRSDRVAVFGDGRLGLLSAMVFNSLCDEVLLVGKHDEKLAIARGQGIKTVLAQNFSPDKSWDVTVEATGSPAGFDAAIAATRPAGTIILKSTFVAESGMNMAMVVVNEITIMGSRCGPFDAALRALREKRFDVTPLITARFSLDDGLAAMAAATSGNNIKVLIDVD